MLTPTGHDFSDNPWPSKWVEAKIRPVKLQIRQPPLPWTVSRLVLLLSLFCSGIAATLAWQGYAHMTGEMIANSFPQLAWLLPQPAVRLQSPDVVAPTAPAIPSSSSEHLKVISLALAVVRQGMDQLAADQQQMAIEIAKVREAQQEIRDKIISAPPRQRPPAPARRSVPQKTLAH